MRRLSVSLLFLLLASPALGQTTITLTPLEPIVENPNEVPPDCCTYKTSEGTLTIQVKDGFGVTALGNVTLKMPDTVSGTNQGTIFQVSQLDSGFNPYKVNLTVTHLMTGVNANYPIITVWSTTTEAKPCVNTSLEPKGQFANNQFTCPIEEFSLYPFVGGSTVALMPALITVKTAGGPNGIGSIERTFNVEFRWLVGEKQEVDFGHVEPVQVAQAADIVDFVPLVTGKSTTVRVFPKNIGATPVTGGISGAITTDDFKEVLFSFNSAIAPIGSSDPDNQRSSLNFVLPLAWTRPKGQDGRILLHLSLSLNGGPRKFQDYSLQFTKPPGWPNIFRVVSVVVCAKDFAGTQKCADPPPDEIANLMKKLYPVAEGYPVPDGSLQYVPLLVGKQPWPGRLGTASTAANATDNDAIVERRDFTKFLKEYYYHLGSPADQLVAWIPAVGGVRSAEDAFKDVRTGSLGHVWWQVAPTEAAPADQAILARGIAYNLGLRDNPGGLVGRGAFDATTINPIPSTAAELMNRAAGGVWLSKANFQLLYDAVVTRPAPAPKVKLVAHAADGASEYLIIGGTVSHDGGAGQLDPGFRVTSANPGDPSDPNGTHCLRFGSDPATDYCFTPFYLDPNLDGGFAVKAPFPAGATRMALIQNGGAELTAIAAASAPPSLQILSPQAGDSWEGPRTIQWSASDPDGNPLVYQVQYSADNGASWTPLTLGLQDTQLNVDGAQIAGGSQVLFRVLASNGLLTTTATVGPVTVTQNPKLATDVTSLAFGNVTTGGFVDGAVTVSNSGSGPLSLSLQLPDGPFRVLSPGSTSAVVQAGGQRRIVVRFAPVSSGTEQATLVLSRNDPTQPDVKINLTGAAFDTAVPSIGVAPPSLDFGTVNIGQPLSQKVTVSNSGSGPLSVTSLTASSPQFTVTSPTVSASSPLLIDPGQSADVTVAFAPANTGAVSGTLTIASNDPTRPQISVPLSGTGAGTGGVQTTQLVVDDNTFETIVGFPQGTARAYFVNRLTPPSYPATLRSVQIVFFNQTDGLQKGAALNILSGANQGGSANINNISLASTASAVAATDQFNSFTVTPITIQSGDFVVGFSAVNPPNFYLMAEDTSSGSKQRSYLSTDGSTFTAVDSVPQLGGNFGIRATVDVGGSGSGGVPACVSPPSNLVSWWAGDGNANDLTGGNNGTVQGGTSFGTGEVGQAFQFDGSTGYVQVGNPANLKLTTAITMDAWINPRSVRTQTAGPPMGAILTKWAQNFGDTSDSDSYGLWLMQNGGTINLFSAIHQAGAKEPNLQGGTIPLNTWTHVAMTFDSTSGQYVLYVNGKAVASASNPGAIFATNHNVLIGREDSSIGRMFDGLVDEVEIFNRALTASEIQAIFNAGSAGQCKTGSGSGGGGGGGGTGSLDTSNPLSTNLVGLFAMNEGTGTTDKNLADGQTASFCTSNSQAPCTSSSGTPPTWNTSDPSIVFHGDSGAPSKSYLNAGTDPIFDKLPVSQMTVVARIFVNTVKAAGICEKNDNNAVDGFVFGIDGTGGGLQLTVEKSSANLNVETAGTITAGKWIQVAVTWDGTKGTAADAQIFVNGVSQTSFVRRDSGSGTLGYAGATNKPFNIGTASGLGAFSGSLDGKMAYLAVYKGRILTPAEMNQLDAKLPVR